MGTTKERMVMRRINSRGTMMRVGITGRVGVRVMYTMK